MATHKRSDTILVNEVLAFIQNKLDVMDQISLTQILTSSYSEDDIVKAKKVLAETAVTKVRVITRQRDGHGKKDIEDIFKLFHETDPDDVPTYVARDLHKLPPVTFDHVDVTRLLKDITALRADVTDLRTKLTDSEQVVAGLKNEVCELRNKFVPVLSPQSAGNINTQRGVKRCQTSPVSKTTENTDAQVIDRPGPATLTPGVSTTQPAQIAPLPTPPVHQQPKKKSYAQASRHPQPNQVPHTGVGRPKVDDEGFTLVKKKSRTRPSRNRRGTAIATVASEFTLRVVDPTIAIYISRLDPKTSGEEVLRFVKERTKFWCKDPSPMQLHLQRLESARETNFKSYVLKVPAKHRDMFFQSDFWPAGIVYRRYRDARKSGKP